jgi:hypothetical protein
MQTGLHQTGSGHMSTPDPFLGPVQGPGMYCPGTLGPPVGTRTPYEGVRIPFQGSSLHTWRSKTNLGGPDYISGGSRPTLGVRTAYPGSDALPWGSRSLLMPWSISPSLATWRLRTHPRGGVGRCCGPRIAA